MSPDLQGLDPGLLLAPFAAGLLVLATHVPLGIEVLRRGIIFIDLAVAQVAALGAVAASLVDLDAVFHESVRTASAPSSQPASRPSSAPCC
jgi:ABC-type Mn2+/Zn2+ transport system permease subunit